MYGMADHGQERLHLLVIAHIDAGNADCFAPLADYGQHTTATGIVKAAQLHMVLENAIS